MRVGRVAARGMGLTVEITHYRDEITLLQGEMGDVRETLDDMIGFPQQSMYC